jgi:hypothetical protein
VQEHKLLESVAKVQVDGHRDTDSVQKGWRGAAVAWAAATRPTASAVRSWLLAPTVR